MQYHVGSGGLLVLNEAPCKFQKNVYKNQPILGGFQSPKTPYEWGTRKFGAMSVMYPQNGINQKAAIAVCNLVLLSVDINCRDIDAPTE